MLAGSRRIDFNAIKPAFHDLDPHGSVQHILRWNHHAGKKTALLIEFPDQIRGIVEFSQGEILAHKTLKRLSKVTGLKKAIAFKHKTLDAHLWARGLLRLSDRDRLAWLYRPLRNSRRLNLTQHLCAGIIGLCLSRGC